MTLGTAVGHGAGGKGGSHVATQGRAVGTGWGSRPEGNGAHTASRACVSVSAFPFESDVASCVRYSCTCYA